MSLESFVKLMATVPGGVVKTSALRPRRPQPLKVEDEVDDDHQDHIDVEASERTPFELCRKPGIAQLWL